MTPPVFPTHPRSSQKPSAAVGIPIFTTVFLITVILATAITFILPESFSSTARIKVDHSLTATNSSAYDPYFIQTEFEVIQSQLVLNRVIEKLNLNTEWGKRYFNGEHLKTEESLQILKGRLSLAAVRGTKLIAITAYSESRTEAAGLANSVAKSYQDYSIEKKYPAGAVEILDRAVPSSTPCKPNKPLNLTLGVLCGIFLGGVAGALVWGFKSRSA